MSLATRFSTDSLTVCKRLVEAGLGYAVLPRAACGTEIEAGRLRYAPIREPEISQQIGVAATTALEVPRELATRIGVLMREEVARLTKSGSWPARLVPSAPWDPNFA